MTGTPKTCDLCGLPLRYRHQTLFLSDETYVFCCLGCRQVFRMLSSMPNTQEPATFKHSELFKKCQDLGIIPRSERDLEQQASQKTVSLSQTKQEALTFETQPHRDVLSLNLAVEGMWCPACAWVIEETLLKLPGIENARCVFSTDRVQCHYHPVRTSPGEIIRTIDDLGYRVVASPEASGETYKKTEMLRLIVSALLTVNVMMLSFALYTGFFSTLDTPTITKLSWPIFLMTSIVVFYGGKTIYKKAMAGICHAAFSMETLITTGVFSAYLYSIFNLMTGSLHLYFDTASMLITLVLVGKMLESGAKKKIQKDLTDFLSLQPTKAMICSEHDRNGRYVSVEHLNSGDVFIVETSEIIPADGQILEGTGAVNESSLTGEAKPVIKKPGNRLRSGTTVIEGMFRVKTTATGENTTLGQMIRIVGKTLSEKTPFEGKTDRVLRWFIPLILFLALATGILCGFFGLTAEQAIIRTITVLMIACPCSLGIAIPLAHVAGVSASHRKGILVRNFTAFEQTLKVNAFVFDKTGTITTGQWILHKVIAFPPFTEDKALSLAASLERCSDHPIALAVKQEVKRLSIPPITVENILYFDNGISATTGRVEVKFGSQSFLENDTRTLPDLSNVITPCDSSILSTVYMSYNGQLCAIFLFGDRVKPDAATTVQQLKATGHAVWLISGDGKDITQVTGNSIGISDTFGKKLPHEKAQFIQGIQEKGACVAMVGDGINDSPALTQADLAIAIHSGTDLSREIADITLMKEDLKSIIDFQNLAKQVNRKVRQNLVWAFLYNAFSIPLAMSGVLTPLIAVTAMLLSSLSVIGNTLLLTRNTA